MSTECRWCEGTGMILCTTCGAGPCQPVNRASVCGVGVAHRPCHCRPAAAILKGLIHAQEGQSDGALLRLSANEAECLKQILGKHIIWFEGFEYTDPGYDEARQYLKGMGL